MDWPHLPLDQQVRAHRLGEPGATERLAASLREPTARAVAQFFGDDLPEHDQVVAESLPATLACLARDHGFTGDPVRLAAAIARNRAVDLARWRRRPPLVDPDTLADWLADPRRSILDEIELERRLALLRPALGRLSVDCRDLLRALIVDGLSHEVVRARLGLATVQGVLYRRAICLRRVKAYVAERIHEPANDDDEAEPSGYRCLDSQLGGELWRLDDATTESALRIRLETHVAFCASCRQQQAVTAAAIEGLLGGRLQLGSTAGRTARRIRLLGGLGGMGLAAGLAVLLFLSPAASLPGWILTTAGVASLVTAIVLSRRRRSLASALDGATL